MRLQILLRNIIGLSLGVLDLIRRGYPLDCLLHLY